MHFTPSKLQPAEIGGGGGATVFGSMSEGSAGGEGVSSKALADDSEVLGSSSKDSTESDCLRKQHRN